MEQRRNVGLLSSQPLAIEVPVLLPSIALIGAGNTPISFATPFTSRAVSSIDGVDWLGIDDPGPFTYEAYGESTYNDLGWAAAYGNGKWIVATVNNILHSTDGISWVAHPAILPDTQPFPGPEAYVDTLFYNTRLELWFAGVSTSGESEVVYTSSDGISWTPLSTPFDNGFVTKFADNGSLMIATGRDSTFTSVLMTTTDGSTWTLQHGPADGSGFASGIAWSQSLGLWIAVINGGPPTILSSSDAITWVEAFASGYYAGSVAWSPELDLFALANGPKIFTSPNGSTWTDRSATGGYNSANFNDMIWHPILNLFVAASYSTGVHISSDGTAWTFESMPDGMHINQLAVRS